MSRHQPDSPEAIIARYEQLKGDRGVWESLWQSVSDLVNPTQDFTRQATPGEARRNKMYDTTAPNAAVELGSTAHTLAMNPATEWFNLMPSDPTREIDDEAREWLHGRTMNLLTFYGSSRSGFNTMAFQSLLSGCTYGTAPFIRDPLTAGSLPKYYAIPLNSYVFETDPNGDTTASYREVEYSPRDLVAAFGEDNVSDKTLKLAKDDKGNTKVCIIHAVLLNDSEFVGNSPFKKPWGSIYVERDSKHELRRGGFDHNPYHVFRWRVNAGEIYGRSPGIDLLPEIRKINVISRDSLIAGELVVRPPMMIPANSVQGPISTKPGSMNYYEMGSRDRPEPMVTGANPAAGEGMIQIAERKIKDGFFVDLLRLPDNDRMTATEINARQTQRLQILGPVKSRIDSDITDPSIKADFDLMFNLGMFPPMPDSLEGALLKVEYKSPMAIAQQSSQANNFLQLMGVSAPLLQSDPMIVEDDIDASATFRALKQVLNANVLKLRTPEESARRKQARAQQQAQVQQAQVAAELAGASKDAATAVSTVAETQELQLTG